MGKNYSIKDLVDIDRLRALFENFSKATGFTTGFVSYPEQELLITTGWRDICTKFHRACPASAECCRESNIYLTACLKDLRELSIKPCDNGLVDGATPVIIRGVHIASLATGQVLLAPPDIDFFKGLAAKYGYDTDEYLAALARVPVVTEEQLRSVLAFLSGLAIHIAEEGLSRLQIQESTTELQAANAAISKSEANFRALSDNIPNGITYQLVHTREGHSWFEYISEGVERLYGLTAACALADPGNVYKMLHPDDAPRLLAASEESARMLRICDVDGRIVTSTGEIRWLNCRSTPRRLENGNTLSYGIATDITERKTAEEALSRAHRALQVLKECDEALVRASSEPELLDSVCRILMDIWGARMTWVGFAEDDAKKTVRVAAHSGSDDGYLEKAKLTWADEPRGRGPAGIAIRTHKVCICRDIPNDPCFAPWREAALERGYASTITLPLISNGHCLGALMLYSTQAYAFNNEEVELLKQLAGDLTYGITALRTRAERNQLQGELLAISEREKQHIAQELHDGICQHLAGTAMMSKLLERRLAKKDAPEAEYAKQICELLSTGVEEARNLSHGLHPVKAEPSGLMDALEHMAETVTKLFHIRCSFRCATPVFIESETVATHLFRIAQESVNNAMKHGHANRVLISLHYVDEGISLSIRDNGIGIPSDFSLTGMGTQIMRHRASVIGARVTIRRAGKRGTLVSCTLPFTS